MSLWAFRFVLFYLLFLLVQPQVKFPFLAPWRPAYVCMVIAAILHFASASQENKPIIRFGPATITALLLMFFSYLSLFIGPFQTSSAWNGEIDMIFKNCLCLIMIEAMATTVERVWAVFGTIVISTMWWQKAGFRMGFQEGGTFVFDRMMGPAVSLVQNPNMFGFLLATMIPMYFYIYKHGHAGYVRWFGLFFAIFSVFFALQTGSRTGFLCLLMTGALMLPRLMHRNKGILLILPIVVMFLWGMVGAQNIERFATIQQSIDQFLGKAQPKPVEDMNIDEKSAYDRKMKNKHSLALFKQYPIFGVGVNHDDELIPGEFEFAKGQVHNDWLYAGLQMGLIGMGLYAAFLLTGLYSAFRVHIKMRKSWPALADIGWMMKVILGIYLVGGFFCPMTWNPFLLAIVGAISALWINVKNGSWNAATERT